MSAVGDRRAAGAPELWQGKACVGVDQIGCCCFEFCCIYVLSIDSTQRLGGSDARGVARGLTRAEVAAVAEHREDIALFCTSKFGIRAGGWPKVAGVAGPACA